MKKEYTKQKIPRKYKKKKITYKEYSRLCKFIFNVEDFPKEFDLNLIEQHGWYNDNNKTGISRDHMLSISYGWKRDISPRIIRHPANCELMLYQDNQEKSWRSSINLNQLLYRIKRWERKYKYLNKHKNILKYNERDFLC